MKTPTELLKERLQEIEQMEILSKENDNKEDLIEILNIKRRYLDAIKLLSPEVVEKPIIKRKRKLTRHQQQGPNIRLKNGGTIKRLSMDDYKF